jgi:SAM-dependent methyltransferase
MAEDYRQVLSPRTTPPKAWTSRRVLAELGAEFGACAGVDLEFSMRLRRGRVVARGRFGCWLGARATASFAAVARVLERLEAPEEVRAAQRSAEGPVRQGVGVSFAGPAPEFRLYLHGRSPRTLSNHYRAWRWRPGAPPRHSRYTFHFLPETPAGLKPLDLIPKELHRAFNLLLDDERLQRSSGFWLREGPGGRVEQVDLTFPWCPPAGTLPGLCELARLFELPRDEPCDWRGLPVRHVAARVGADTPSVTLYASAPLGGSWPDDEAAFQEVVRRGARALRRKSEEVFYRGLTPLPPMASAPSDIANFYEGDVSTWQRILGRELHYHAGLFDSPDAEPDDAEMDAALDRAVTELYPFVPAGGRVYDVGCGWGGPLAMWARDLNCPSLGITNSRAQFRHAAARGLSVRLGDAERTLPPGRFDCAILLESFSHIEDKARLLRVLRVFAGRLVMRVNCQDGSAAPTAFGGTMHMVSSARLRELLEGSGWRVRHWRDRRREAVPSVAVWHRRLRSLPPTRDRHLETLRSWCARVLDCAEEWAGHNPLIEVVAE